MGRIFQSINVWECLLTQGETRAKEDVKALGEKTRVNLPPPLEVARAKLGGENSAPGIEVEGFERGRLLSPKLFDSDRQRGRFFEGGTPLKGQRSCCFRPKTNNPIIGNYLLSRLFFPFAGNSFPKCESARVVNAADECRPGDSSLSREEKTLFFPSWGKVLPLRLSLARGLSSGSP